MKVQNIDSLTDNLGNPRVDTSKVANINTVIFIVPIVLEIMFVNAQNLVFTLSFTSPVVLFVLFEWTPSRRNEVGILLGILPYVREQNKHSYFPRPDQF